MKRKRREEDLEENALANVLVAARDAAEELCRFDGLGVFGEVQL